MSDTAKAIIAGTVITTLMTVFVFLLENKARRWNDEIAAAAQVSQRVRATPDLVGVHCHPFVMDTDDGDRRYTCHLAWCGKDTTDAGNVIVIGCVPVY